MAVTAGVGGLRLATAQVGTIKETAFGTYIEPTNVFAAFDINISVSGPSFQRTEAKGHFVKSPEIPGYAEGEISFKTVMAGSGIAATAPYWGGVIRGCGYSEVITPSTGPVVYSPVAVMDAAAITNGFNPQKSSSVTVWEGGMAYSLIGAVGNLKITAKNGEPMIEEWTFKGAYRAVAADTSAGLTVDTVVPPRFLQANTLSLNGLYGPIITAWTYDTGNVLSPVYNANVAVGLTGYVITDRRPMMTLDPEMDTVSAHDFFGIWRAGTVVGFVSGPLGTGTANKITITAPGIQYRAPKMTERNGVRALELELPIVGTGIDGSDFSISIAN